MPEAYGSELTDPGKSSPNWRTLDKEHNCAASVLRAYTVTIGHGRCVLSIVQSDMLERAAREAKARIISSKE